MLQEILEPQQITYSPTFFFSQIEERKSKGKENIINEQYLRLNCKEYEIFVAH
jgi:hypothetical protein